MQKHNVIRIVLFVVFSSIGVAASSFSMLCDDFVSYYQNKQSLKAAEESLILLESLNDDYDALLEQLEHDPNVISRIAPATLGTAPADANAVYPRAIAEQLTAARKSLEGDRKPKTIEPTVPVWLVRCSEPRQRTILFMSGAFLILISFIWFGFTKQNSENQS